MAKQVTKESLAEIISKKGLAAAQAELTERREKLIADIDKAEAAIKTAEEALEAAHKEDAQLDSLLFAAVNLASKQAGILPATAMREKLPTGKRNRMTAEQAEAAKAKVAATVKAAGKDGAALKDVAKALPDVPKPTLTKFLGALTEEKAIKREGEKKNTRYFA